MTEEIKKRKQKPVPHHNHRPDEHELEADLRQIYRDEDGHIPDMTSLEHSKDFTFSKKLLMAILLLGAMSAAAWSGFMYFKNTISFTSKNVSLEITAPFTAISGEQYAYIIDIKNNESTDIDHGTMTVNLPYGFFLQDSNLPHHNDGQDSAKPTNIYSWDIPSIPAHNDLKLSIHGVMIGEQSNKPIMSSNFKYSPKDVTSTFETSTSFSTEIADSILSITSDYTSQVMQDQAQNITIHLKNVSKTENISDLKLHFEIPDTFTLPTIQASSLNQEYDKTAVATTTPTTPPTTDASQTAPKETFNDLTAPQLKEFNETKTLSLKGLAAGSELVYVLSGTFKVLENGEQQIKFSVDAADSKGNYVSQGADELAIQVIKGDLITDLIINGKADNQSVSFGGNLQYLIHLKNKSKTALGDVNVRMVIDSPAVDWSTLKDDAKGTVSSNQILWTKDNIKGLEVLLPEGELDINFSIGLKSFGKLTTYKSGGLTVSSYYEATVNKVEQLASSKNFDSKTIVNTFNSNTELSAQGKYFDEQGQSVGSGPLPPTVNQTTTYEIVWQIKNSFNELTDVNVSAELPAGVTFAQGVHADAGDVAQEGSKITWNVNRMPTSIDHLTATFLVSVTPQAKDVNKLLTLIQESTLTATDKETTGTISITDAPITTDLTGDDAAKGKGLVKAE